jgi:alpha-1,6-mannosyltransferase
MDPARLRDRSRLALWASATGITLVALVASVPGAPLQPVLPDGVVPGGPFAAIASAVGLDAVSSTALVTISVIAVTFGALAFLFVLREAWRGNVSLRSVVVLAIAAHLVVLTLPLLVSRDVYSYIAYGQIAGLHHANPYVQTPADFPLDPIASLVGPKWIATPAVYGPLFTSMAALLTRAIGGIAALVDVFRVIAAAASLGTLAIVVWLAKRLAPRRVAFAAAAFALNPVVLFQSVGSGHNDLLVGLSIAGALALVVVGRTHWAVAALAAGTLVKAPAALPLVLLIVWVVARRPPAERLRALASHVGLAAAIGLAFAAPYLQREDPTLGMAELAGHEGWLAPSRLARRVLDAISADTAGVAARVLFAIVLVAVVGALGWRVVRRAHEISPVGLGAAWGWALLALMLLGPVLLPWYATWALPLVWLVPLVPRGVLLTTSTALVVSQWTAEPDRFPGAYDANVLVGHYVITPIVVLALAALLLDLRRRLAAGSPLEDGMDEVSAAAHRD